MSKIFDNLKELNDKPNQELIDCFNCYFASRTEKYRLISNDKVKPCFFSGNIEGNIEDPGKIVTISLNPHYEPDTTEQEQDKMKFKQWYKHCQFRFKKYPRYQKVHPVFKNLFKVIVPCDRDIKAMTNDDKKDYLQDHLINLDWCPYYSESFPTFKVSDLPAKLKEAISEWDKTLKSLITKARPRYIFVHGAPLADWVERNTTPLELVKRLKNNFGKHRKLLQGCLKNRRSIPVFYLTHYINVVNKNETLEKIRKHLNSDNSM